MGRWQPDARSRLEQAALVLYGERGYERVTVAEIAAHAGLTERTFFRHFADKREVLFAGAATLENLLVDAVVRAPEATTPLEAVAAALTAAGPIFDERRDGARQRQAVIDATPELQERELIKLARQSSALAEALRQRGVDEPAAHLAAEAGIAVFKVAFGRWVRQTGERGFADFVRESLADLRSITA